MRQLHTDSPIGLLAIFQLFKKVKGFPYSLPSVGHGANPGVVQPAGDL